MRRNIELIPTPFISVIIPTCFREAMLIDCVASVVRQEYTRFEIIIVDQAPEPRLQSMLRERFAGEERIQYMHVVHAGAARARNAGVRRASGVIVAFIDDDAVAEPDWLGGIADAFGDRMRPALMAGRILPLWEGSRPAWYPSNRQFLLGLYDIGDRFCRLPDGDLPIGANMAGLRQVILAHGGFEESLGPNYFRKRKMITGEETILGQRIRAAGYTIVYQPNATVNHRVGRRKQTRQFFLKRHFWEGVTTMQQMYLLQQVGANPWPHCLHHVREISLALARFALPGHGGVYLEPHRVIRMIALSRVFFSLGVLWAIRTAGKPAAEKASCASA